VTAWNEADFGFDLTEIAAFDLRCRLGEQRHMDHETVATGGYSASEKRAQRIGQSCPHLRRYFPGVAITPSRSNRGPPTSSWARSPLGRCRNHGQKIGNFRLVRGIPTLAASTLGAWRVA
jgi:hypothetical protein